MRHKTVLRCVAAAILMLGTLWVAAPAGALGEQWGVDDECSSVDEAGDYFIPDGPAQFIYVVHGVGYGGCHLWTTTTPAVRVNAVQWYLVVGNTDYNGYFVTKYFNPHDTHFRSGFEHRKTATARYFRYCCGTINNVTQSYVAPQVATACNCHAELDPVARYRSSQGGYATSSDIDDVGNQSIDWDRFYWEKLSNDI